MDVHPCPHCGKMTPIDNTRCLYCQELIDLGFPRVSRKMILRGVVIVILIGFIIWCLR